MAESCPWQAQMAAQLQAREVAEQVRQARRGTAGLVNKHLTQGWTEPAKILASSPLAEYMQGGVAREEWSTGGSVVMRAYVHTCAHMWPVPASCQLVPQRSNLHCNDTDMLGCHSCALHAECYPVSCTSAHASAFVGVCACGHHRHINTIVKRTARALLGCSLQR
jgi:hypothetical protein